MKDGWFAKDRFAARLVALHCWTKAVEGKEEDHDVSDVDEDNWKEKDKKKENMKVGEGQGEGG